MRTRFARRTAAGLVSSLASLRPRPGEVVGYATRIVLRELAGAPSSPAPNSTGPGELVAVRAPGLLALLLVAAGDHPERLRSEAASLV
ncbi:MAG TPA: hypothetical protein VK594_22775, partial [Streptosporangiaceae bacterium]|nr:hypothetical protein [Streptosporangiaceae bacterium]